jgi:hypothetical protein
MSYRSNLPRVRQSLAEKQKQGLMAAANLYAAAVSERLGQGFKGGRFTTGESAQSVKVATPERTGDGWAVRIGTDEISNLMWELGHFNTFTKQFERVEVWIPTLLTTRQAQLAAFQRIARSVA